MAKKITEANKFSFAELTGITDELIKKTSIIHETTESTLAQSTIGTGIYVLNAVLSGDIYGGIQSNRITCFGGETGCLFPSEKINIYIMQTKNKKHNVYNYEK